MSLGQEDRTPGPALPVLAALTGPDDSLVAAALAGRRDVALTRRCADVAELVAAAEAGLGRAVLLSARLVGLDAEVVRRAREAGCAVLGLAGRGDGSAGRLTALGVADLVAAPAAGRGPTETAAGEGERLAQAVLRAAGRTRRPDDLVPDLPSPARGGLVAVWGPPGAPGRTTVAVTVAAELAAAGDEVLLVDADTHAPAVAQLLGLLDEASGIAAAARAGVDGRLDPLALSRLAPLAAPRLRVLTGIERSARWAELRPAGTAALWRSARRLVDQVVVDLAAPLDEDDPGRDAAAPHRNGLTLEALRVADRVLVVGSADPVGLRRLVRSLQELAVAVPGAGVDVVVNRVRESAVGRRPRVRIRDVLARFAGVPDVHLVPDDRPALDRAVLAGRTLGEQEPASPARSALAELAGRVRGGAGVGFGRAPQ